MREYPIVAMRDVRGTEDVQPPCEHEVYDTPEKDVLVLNYTLACPLSCDFCCYGCHPKRTEKMSLGFAKDLVSQASAMSNFSSVGLTGGEVFMYEDELISLAEHISACGLPFTIATSAHWASSEVSANRLAETLVMYGLKRINISYDKSHSAFIPKENILNAANAFAKLKVPVYVIGTFSNATETLEEMVPELSSKDYISLRTKRIAKVGRAKKANVDYAEVQHDAIKTCYRRTHHDVVVFWDGEVYPCCSTFNRATSGLSIGNAFATPLLEIWRRLEYSSLFRRMKSEGFSALLELLKDREPALFERLPELNLYPGACSFCNAVFSDEKLSRAIRAFFASYETNALLSSKDELVLLLGEEVVARLFQQHLPDATFQFE